MHHPPVTIVGAGPTGCTAALLLAAYGIRSVLIEQRTAPGTHPAAHVINARTMEVWARISPDLAAEMMAAAAPPERSSEIRWCESLFGRTLGTLDLSRPPDDWSPYRTVHLGQHLLLPILWREVARNPLIDFRTGTAFSSRRDSGYLLGCDGAGSTVRCDIPMDGEVLGHMVSVHFRADLGDAPLPVVAWIYNPRFVGTLVHHLHGDFVLIAPYLPPEDPSAFDADYWRNAIPSALGRDVPVEIRSTGRWTMTSQVARTWRNGRTFLVGDAAHRFPPTGGFGLNMGVQDAHNLAWKLAAVLEDRAPDAVLDSYEAERRPVVARFAAQSVDNHFRMDRIGAVLGITSRDLQRATRAASRLPKRLGAVASVGMALARQQTRKLALPGVRERFAREIPAQMGHFDARGLELGFVYTAGLVRPERRTRPGPIPSRPPLLGDGVRDYRPTTWPGARLPHVPVRRDGREIGSHGLLPLRKWLVLVGPGQRGRWIMDGRVVEGAVVEELVVEEVEDPRFELRGGAVLVRPDGHVAWRTDDPDGAAALAEVFRQLWPGLDEARRPLPERAAQVSGTAERA